MKKEGLPVPLHCTWYNVGQRSLPNSDKILWDDFRVIENVTGSYYQPSVIDVGYKICVHAIPASDAEEYQGMPMFAEVGPLILDPIISSRAQQFIEQAQSFQVTIEKFFSQTIYSGKTPVKTSVCLQRDCIVFQDIKIELQISQHEVRVIQHSNSKVEILLRQSKIIECSFSFKDSGARDVFYLAFNELQNQPINETEDKIEEPIEQHEIMQNTEIQQEEIIVAQIEEEHKDNLFAEDSVFNFPTTISASQQQIDFDFKMFDPQPQIQSEREKAFEQEIQDLKDKLQLEVRKNAELQAINHQPTISLEDFSKIEQQANFYKQEVVMQQAEIQELTQRLLCNFPIQKSDICTQCEPEPLIMQDGANPDLQSKYQALLSERYLIFG